jgi:hypothetical protein
MHLALWALLVVWALPVYAQNNLFGENTEDYLLGRRSRSQPIQQVFSKMPKHLQNFVSAYEKVKRLSDTELLETLIHPASLACENEKTKLYFDTMRQFYLSEELPWDYEIGVYEVRRDMRDKLKRRLRVPVAPTHVMYIEFEDMGWQRFLREEAEPEPRFYEVIKCPTPSMIEDIKRELQSQTDADAAP